MPSREIRTRFHSPCTQVHFAIMPESIDFAAKKADGRGGNVDHTGRKEAARHPMGWADDVDELGVGAVRLQELGETTSPADAKDGAELLG